jgi:hypothetical protein
MRMLKRIRTTSKRKKKLGKLLRRLPSGGSSTLASMTKTAPIFKGLSKLPPIRSESPRKP